MSSFPFPHDGPIHFVGDDRFEIALYAHDGQKYKAVREVATTEWEQVKPKQIPAEQFYMLVACIQRRKRG